MTNQIKYKWATLGTGVIANELAQALEALGGKLYSVANRTYDKGVAFAEKYGIEKVYKEIDEVFEDPEVDIIYISTPHNTHIITFARPSQLASMCSVRSPSLSTVRNWQKR